MKHRIFLLFFVLIFCISALCIFLSLKQEKSIVTIRVDGKLFDTIDLSKTDSPYEIKLPNNTILVEKGDISVIHANCPDKLCVKQGKISDNVFPIVCLPNKLVIQIEE